MEIGFVIGVGWVVFMIGGIVYHKSFKTPAIKVWNVSDRAVKHKKYQSALNDRAKGMFK